MYEACSVEQMVAPLGTGIISEPIAWLSHRMDLNDGLIRAVSMAAGALSLILLSGPEIGAILPEQKGRSWQLTVHSR
jgi:hypothetical protein